ncbi:anaerobic dimethyl sulfoxide reductase chain A [Vibrio variabilis]|uniref:Anaerobic dimethyl sulfoxide reductase chain A n=1 Tax=Vibrio variabilis TaxID=990271 RepID=A0ABQ0JPC2_9VIBR|nr:anaerobic dimethyl sulfoxide reductase chain A [Vibrio variabilis]
MKLDASLPDFETVRKQGIVKRSDPNGHYVAYQAFREDPENNPLTTPSGKVEIYSEELARLAAEWELPEGDVIHPLPIYVSTSEAGIRQCAINILCSSPVSILKRAATQPTVTLMCLSKPLNKRCGSTQWTLSVAVLKTAIASRSITTVVKFESTPKSPHE